jgi:hypothetical protein
MYTHLAVFVILPSAYQINPVEVKEIALALVSAVVAFACRTVLM